MVSCSNIARLIQQGWRLEVVQDGVRADRFHARVIAPVGRDGSHHHLGQTVLGALDSLDVYIGVVAPASALETGRDQPVVACGSMNERGHGCDFDKGHSGLHDWEQP